MEEQAGFRVGRGCRDQIFMIRQLAEKTIEKDGKMYAAFIDLGLRQKLERRHVEDFS